MTESQQASATYARLTQASRAYLRLAEVLQEALREAEASGAAQPEALRRGFEAYAKAGLPGLEPWQSLLAAAPGLTRSMAETLDRLAIPPDMAPMREARDWLRQWTQHSAAYADAAATCAQLLSRTQVEALERFDASQTEADVADDLAPLRQCYDACVDAGEAAYADLASEPAWLDAQARMTNALMALRKHERDGLERLLQQWNLPGPSDYAAALQRLHTMRRELRALTARVEALEARLGRDGELKGGL